MGQKQISYVFGEDGIWFVIMLPTQVNIGPANVSKVLIAMEDHG
jgi:hypothetical protein